MHPNIFIVVSFFFMGWVDRVGREDFNEQVSYCTC